MPSSCHRSVGRCSEASCGAAACIETRLRRPLGISLSFAAVGLEELSFRRYPGKRDPATLLLIAVVENVGYRQLSIRWRLRGMISKARGASAWGAMERKGFATSDRE